jgi:hypothetical protein
LGILSSGVTPLLAIFALVGSMLLQAFHKNRCITLGQLIFHNEQTKFDVLNYCQQIYIYIFFQIRLGLKTKDDFYFIVFIKKNIMLLYLNFLNDVSIYSLCDNIYSIKYIKFNFSQKKIITLNLRQISIRGKREQLEVDSAP